MRIAIITTITLLLCGCTHRQPMPEKYIAKQQVARVTTPAMVANTPVRPVTTEQQVAVQQNAPQQPEVRSVTVVPEPPKEQIVVRTVQPQQAPPPPTPEPQPNVAPQPTVQNVPQEVKPAPVSQQPPSSAVIVRKPRQSAGKTPVATQTTSTQPIPDAPRGYHIIIGSYTTAQRHQAEKMYRSLMGKGHKAHLIADAPSGRIRVSIECLDSPDTAATARDGYMVKLKRDDLWVLKY
ncbi:MAG: hypothetical protein ACRDDZ_01000 [Marinifilaceae bacterium]